jgi:hypothetical protein
MSRGPLLIRLDDQASMILQTRQIGFVRSRTYVVLVASMAVSLISGSGK